MSDILNVSLRRRSLLGAGIAGALVLGFRLPVNSARAAHHESAAAGAALNAFVAIGDDGMATIQSPYIEMGQGTYTTIPALVAEEMDLPMNRVRVEQAPPGTAYHLIGPGTRFTGGSLSIRTAFGPMRKAGATARAMLLQAAAGRWQLPVSELETQAGRVLHKASGRSLDYAEVATEAAALTPPEDVPLKGAADFFLLGTPAERTDVPAKTDGSAEFGADISVPGMLIAAIAQAPVFGGEVSDYDEQAALAIDGVVAVNRIDNALAVVGRTWWHASQGLKAARPTFTAGPAPDFNIDAHEQAVRAALEHKGAASEAHGEDARALLGTAADVLTADYHVPFLAHATMEPQNCTALVTEDSCTIWTPNQGVERFIQAAAAVSGLPQEAITIHTPYLGGGFGRRFAPDFTAQAVAIAMQHKGTPIKLIWSREEDTQHDFYRPMVAARFRANLGGDGLPTALHATIAGDGPMKRHFAKMVEQVGYDESVVEGAIHQSYGIANRLIEYVYVETPPPIGFWRSVGNSHNAFFKESFIDEMAIAAGIDALEYRRRLLADAPRVRKVLDTAAEMAGWHPAPRDVDGVQRAQGIAIHEAYGTIVAQVAEVSVAKDGSPRVHKVWCAVDCGMALNPRIITMQMESGISTGLSAALHEKVQMRDGRTQAGNFDTYPILRAAEMPAVEVSIVDSGEAVGGIGEPGTPPIAPAVTNALFNLTGQRVRNLPIGKLAG